MRQLSAFALLVAGFFGTVTHASAQVARDGNFYEEVRFINCNNVFTCQLVFSATPQLILFSKINCLITSQSGALYAAVFEIGDVPGGGTRRREFLPIPSPIAISGSITGWSFSSPTDFMVSATKLPVIEGFFATPVMGGTMECKITGRTQ